MIIFGSLVVAYNKFCKRHAEKLWVIIWKNLFLRKNQWLVSGIEIVFPILVAVLFTALANKAISVISGPSSPSGRSFSESRLKWSDKNFNDTCSFDPSSSAFIAFAPENPATTKIVEEVANEVCGHAKDATGSRAIIRVIPLKDVDELESQYKSNRWGNSKSKFYGALVFREADKLPTTGSGGKGAEVSYEIRMKPGKVHSIKELLPKGDSVDISYIGEGGPFIDPNENNVLMYNKAGFLGLQLSVDKVLTRMLTRQNPKDNITLRTSPDSPYSGFFSLIKKFMLSMFTFFFIMFLCFMIPSITRNVVSEKQSGIAELLRIAGVYSWIQILGWLIHAILPHLITVSIISLILCVPSGTRVALLEFSDITLVWIVFILYILSAASFSIFICSLFQKPILATTLAQILWMVTLIVGTVHTFIYHFLPKELAFCLLPNLAFLIVMRNMRLSEEAALDDTDGAHWSNIHKHLNAESVSTRDVILMFLLDIVVYLLLALYLDSVLPSAHGVRRPWYIFNCGDCRCRRRKTPQRKIEQPSPSDQKVVEAAEASESGADTGTQEKGEDAKLSNENKDPDSQPQTNEEAVAESEPVPESFEPAPKGAVVGINVINMFKRFGRYKVAVNDVSLQMYSGDIFALLGHNGAGKTTIISMLTGFFAPTSGTAIINGHDIRKNMNRARESMGLCPQHNMLFDYLGVSAQLLIFGMLRGLTYKQAKEETNFLLAKINLQDKAQTLARKLSGGQKRKLSLALALIGGTKVAILDEPTSGLDPQARREIWDLLLELRGERTILLTTHFMEEADVLGDRIGIMAQGSLQCCGSSTFLKKHYGTGYKLRITLTLHGVEDTSEEPDYSVSESAIDAVLATVQKYISNASAETNVRSDRRNPEIVLTLPAETATTKTLGKMFSALTANKEKLKIQTMGLAQTTMDEVFVTVGAKAEAGIGQMLVEDGEEWARVPKVKRGMKLILHRFLVLFLKKMLYFYRRWGLLICQVLIPLVMFILVVHATNSWATPVESPPKRNQSQNSSAGARINDNNTASNTDSLPITLDGYDFPVTIFSDKSKPDYTESVIGPSAYKISGSVVKELLKVAKRDRRAYKRRHIVAAEVSGTSDHPKITTMFNSIPYHSAPLAINLASNILLKYLDPNANNSIRVINHPFPEYPDASSRRRIFQNESGSLKNPLIIAAAVLMMFILPLGLIIMVACFIAIPIEERVSQAKQLQMMAGANPLLYWGSFFLWDYTFYSLIVFFMLCYLYIFDYWSVYTYGFGDLIFLLILSIYGAAVIVFTYLFSLRLSSVTGGFTFMIFINLFTGGLGFIPEFYDGQFYQVAFVRFIGHFFPNYYLTTAVNRYVMISVINSDCQIYNLACDKPLPYLTWSTKTSDIIKFILRAVEKKKSTEEELNASANRLASYFNDSIPGLVQDLVFLAFIGLIYLALLLLIEFRLFERIKKACCNKQHANVFQQNRTDDDVYEETLRVDNMIANGLVGEECMVAQNLCKSFDDFAAVNQLSFGVHYGECFGLLGVNGAGKTTAFRMITGDETPSNGDAFGFGTSLNFHARKFFQNIGYCPQFDAFIGDFTGREMLQLFAGLRGVASKHRRTEAMIWLRRVGLSESANVRCKKYSGGMKRRLSTAMALIGDPALLLLDEPTTGVDPVSRRQFWKILDKLRQSGQSVILTSHSMEECEAICSRLGIMVNGQFQCFGGVPHLKTKFGQGYSLTLKLKTDTFAADSPEMNEKLIALHEKISKTFPPCYLKDKHQTLLQYHLQDSSLTWDVLYNSLEEIKAEFEEIITDFNVDETKLEEVFLAFARVQQPERKTNPTICKQICTCRC